MKAGEKYNKLTAMNFVETRKGRNYWKFKCDCGNETVVQELHAKSGNTTSCGCALTDFLVERNTTHGLSKTKLYKVFHSMKRRCYNPKASNYKRYGGRGIRICDEWLEDYMNFHTWAMDNGYEEGLSIERIDNDGDYEPSNCTWATPTKQARNRRPKGKVGVTGISQRKNGQYWARITVKGKTIDLGSYDTLEEATEVRAKAENKYFK